MWLIWEAQVGTVAYRRMLRDDIIVPMLPGVARAPDIEDCRGIRAAALATHSRPGLVASGLAALWVHLGGTPPETLDLVADEHRHLRSWTPSMPSRIHATTYDYGDAVARPADALVDALRWADLGIALPRAFQLVAAGAVDAGLAVRALDRISSHDRSWKRAWSAWGALRDAQGLPIRVAARCGDERRSGNEARDADSPHRGDTGAATRLVEIP
ncbi:hypothetical protein [Demequina sp. NBRC 110055]|uniref:hypothetical protein n=1 Tax=Demequina sp. NBRC 110055 TaxID=1570344 RepID=UPI001185F394|nr:hypothetical protein [Demequina sp. NBRC 110055]